jgi:hypothetical protein
MYGMLPLVVFYAFEAHEQYRNDLAHSLVEEVRLGKKCGALNHERALQHVDAALTAATPDFPVELLLSIPYPESCYNPDATSYLINGVRASKIKGAPRAPKWARAPFPPKEVSGPYFCGVTQVAAGKSWERCKALRDIPVSYVVAVQELTKWSDACRVKYKKKNRIVCTLRGYNGGWGSIERWSSGYPHGILNRARRILNECLLRAERRGRPAEKEV